MKLSLEIHKDEFTFEYEVGTSKQHNSGHLTADMLVTFAELLKTCSRAADESHREWQSEAIKNALKMELRKEAAGPMVAPDDPCK